MIELTELLRFRAKTDDVELAKGTLEKFLRIHKANQPNSINGIEYEILRNDDHQKESAMIVPFERRKPAFWIGDTVYLVCCDEPERGLVTSVDFRQAHESYEVTWGTGSVTYHNDFELSREHAPVYFPGSSNE